MTKKIKLSDKQKEVIELMRKGHILHWIGGLNPSCFLSKSFSFKVSTATAFRILHYKLIIADDDKLTNRTYRLTELGKQIEL